MRTTATAPLHTRHRSSKPSSLLNRLLKFPMAVRLPSLMHSGRSVFPKSTVSHLRLQYGYSRYVFPSTRCTRCQCQRQGARMAERTPTILRERHAVGGCHCRDAHAEYGGRSRARAPPVAALDAHVNCTCPQPQAILAWGETRVTFLGGPGHAPAATVVEHARGRRARGAGGRDDGGGG